jgi:hypothetical protein
MDGALRDSAVGSTCRGTAAGKWQICSCPACEEICSGPVLGEHAGVEASMPA